MEKYDYIICGGGASGLLLSNAFIKDEFFNDKKILIIERESKTLNDKTFGFWNDKESVLDDMVFKEWAVSYTHLRAHETREDRGWRRVL